MSDGFGIKGNHKGAPVTVEIRVGWAETATYDQVTEALTLLYAKAICRIRGHRFRFHQLDPITITHSLRCSRCGLTGWPNLYRLSGNLAAGGEFNA